MKIREKENEILPIQLLTPLTAVFYSDDSRYEFDEEVDGEEHLSGAELVQYEPSIQEMVDKENSYGAKPGQGCNLMDYFDGNHSITEKVKSAVVSVENIDGTLYGCTTLELTAYLESAELNELCDYITGQYSDGWGEGFEQRDIPIDGGYLNVHFYNDQFKQFQQRKQPEKRKDRSPEKQKVKSRERGESR